MLLFASFGACQTPSPTTSIVDHGATKETKALYRNLKALQGEKILFGHQDATAYGIGWKYEDGQSDVKKVTGDHPAVHGWDWGQLELGDSVNLDQVHFALIRQRIIEAYERGGINTVSWHLRNPLTEGSSWDVSSDKVVQSILPGGSQHQVFVQWLDRVADFSKSLHTANGTAVPVLFRPFHEHTGSWFWWGGDLCSREDYIALWQFTVTYLRDQKNVHNFLYCYSPDFVTTDEAYFDRYPGDDYVDVLGLDLYHRNGESEASNYITAVQNVMKIISEYSAAHDKVFVFSETGSETLPMPDWFTNVLYKAISSHKPAYVLVWRNAFERPNHYYAPYPDHPAATDFNAFKALSDVAFEQDLPDMYQ